MRTKVEGMTTRVRELEAVNSSLQRRIQEIQDRMDEMAVNHRYYSKQLFVLVIYGIVCKP